MTDITYLRARRFNALYQLLTGAAHPELPTAYQDSDHLRKDVGLPEQHRRSLIITPLGTFSTDSLGL